MKSKAEIIDALQICMLTPDCKGCAYHPDVVDESCNCNREMIEDIINILSKSDFEVVEEVLQRSKKHDWLGTGISGEGYTLELLDVFDAPTINFDGEGNIL